MIRSSRRQAAAGIPCWVNRLKQAIWWFLCRQSWLRRFLLVNHLKTTRPHKRLCRSLSNRSQLLNQLPNPLLNQLPNQLIQPSPQMIPVMCSSLMAASTMAITSARRAATTATMIPPLRSLTSQATSTSRQPIQLDWSPAVLPTALS